MDRAVVVLQVLKRGLCVDLDIPLNITANDLIIALNSAYQLGISTDSIQECFLRCENPIALLRGNRTLETFGVRNGSVLYALMDNDFFNQAVKGGGVQFRDVGVFLNGFHPLAGVTRKPDFIGQLLPAFLNLCFQLGLFLLRLFHQQIEVRFADTSGNHVLIQPQHHLFQNVNPFLVFG